MSKQNGSYDHASIGQAVAALLLGEAVHVHFRDEAERVRLGYRFRRMVGGQYPLCEKEKISP